MTEKKRKELEIRKKILIDQLKIMDLYPEDTIKYFGSQREVMIRIDKILDEINQINRFLTKK